MCVLGVADKRRPTDDELTKMAESNPDGAGVAWRERSSPTLAAPDVVKWEKGLTLTEMKEFCAQLPMPFAFHFRIASCGGRTQEMTHPFPIEREMRPQLSGELKGFVLFHNGHWAPWKDKGIDNAIHHKIKVPEGKWSDSRVMAWLAHIHGHAILELIDEKVILFGPNKIEIFHPDGWFRVNDLLVSNRVWEHQNYGGFQGRRTFMGDEDDTGYGGLHSGAGTVCIYSTCLEPRVGVTYYCELHQPPCRYYQCSIPRVAGSENCPEHQPFCTMNGCKNPQQFGKKFCLTHLITAPAAETVVPPEDLVPFRSSPAGEDVARAVLVPAILIDPELQDRSRWARALNPKAIRTPALT